MRICQVMGGVGDGGLEKHFVELCSQLSGKHKIVAIAHPKYRTWFPDTVEFEAFDLARSRRNPILLFSLLNAIKRHRPDIVHAQANKAAAMIGSLSPFLKCKKVATIHNLKKTTKMFTSFDLVIGVSKRVVDNLKNSNSVVIHNGIVAPVTSVSNGRKWLEDELDIEYPRSIIISVGRLVSAKGFDLLIRAMEGIDAYLLIAGDGPEREKLEALVSKLGLRENIFFLGHRNDIPDLLTASDLVVIASRREGFSYVCAEALRLRKVVLSTKVPIPEDVLPLQMIVPIEDVYALHMGIKKFFEGRSQIFEQFEMIWQYADNELSLEGMVAKVERLYWELIK